MQARRRAHDWRDDLADAAALDGAPANLDRQNAAAVTGAYGDDKGGFGRPFRLLEAGP
jgi:hypothetical protein